MFTPSFTITNRLLANIKRINSLITELNTPHFPNIVLMELERMARAVSTHASTSIEGNPLPLTEVKKILKFRPSNIRDSELEIVNYNKALEDLNKQLNQGSFELTLELILSIQKKITDKLLSPVDSGSLRHKPVVVND